MNEKKMKISDFANLVGTSQKTIYSRLNNSSNLPVNEQLNTVSEKVKGRETTFIITTDEQIKYYQNIFGKLPVKNCNYEDILTVNEGNEQVNNGEELLRTNNNKQYEQEMLQQLFTANNELNNRYELKVKELITVNKELAETKGRQLLLEDKAGREGYYINEINQLEKNNLLQKKVIYGLFTVIVILLLVILCSLTYTLTVNNLQTRVNEPQKTESTTEKLSAVQTQKEIKPVKAQPQIKGKNF